MRMRRRGWKEGREEGSEGEVINNSLYCEYGSMSRRNVFGKTLS